MLVRGLMALAALAGNTVVAAATTDAWEAAKHGIARLLGCGDPTQEQLAERRLEETREQLAGATGTDAEQARAALAAQWATRLADLLDVDPGAEADLRVLMQRIQKQLRAEMVSADDHAVAAWRDVNIKADHGGVAAGVLQGTVVPPNYPPEPGNQLGGPGFAGVPTGAGLADRGGFLIQQASNLTLVVGVGRGPEVARQPIRLAPRPLFMAGREELLTQLACRLSAGDGAGPRTVVLSGLAGIGKTSVAVEYAYRQLAEVSVAWQFASVNPAVLAAGFGDLATQLGIPDLADNGHPVASVHAVLARHAAGWLLIFDNAPDMRSVAEFLPPAGHGQVLITSQNQTWPEKLDVPVLAPDVAVGFLVNRTRHPDRQAAAELAAELGRLPLALEQAAAYIQAAGDTLADYLDLFRQRGAAMLTRGEPIGYARTVATTWTLAFGRLEQVRARRGRPAAAAGVLRARGNPAATDAAVLWRARRAARAGRGAAAGAAAGRPVGGR